MKDVEWHHSEFQHHTAVLRRTAYTARSAADFVERTAAQHWLQERTFGTIR